LAVEFAATSHLEDVFKAIGFDQGLPHALEVLRRVVQHVHRVVIGIDIAAHPMASSRFVQ
jgi:hypothetical protein